ncbi:DUF397 domain-containing protein [Streptomyces sp. TS71-3]|uniref:DUF397 domain-containing protein n=1 Tax=Streptomyces sp. TS71-3 TaxID=2733862 RepID=UPI001B2E1503|nr:DUF397 domain-containing protein [Streptomyces sp. TS71-3]GHJ36731.1 hypothetical protein Sm713_23400 [Streptomyces sp. TS71-3]
MRNGNIQQAESQLAWIKSSYSSEEGGECVEVAAHSATVHVRDSKDSSLAGLSVEMDAWVAFVSFAAEQTR